MDSDDEVQSGENGGKSGDEEEERNGQQIKQRNALVVGGQQPRFNAVFRVQVILAFGGLYRYGCHAIAPASFAVVLMATCWACFWFPLCPVAVGLKT